MAVPPRRGLMVAHAEQLDRLAIDEKAAMAVESQVRMPKRVATRSTTWPSTSTSVSRV
jgi:hypothetical protein